MIALYDPYDVISRDDLRAWYIARYGREPDRQLAPSDLGDDWDWHMIGFLWPGGYGLPDERGTFPLLLHGLIASYDEFYREMIGRS